MNSMKDNSDYITMPCSQAVANMLVVDNPHLAKMGLDGFDIYDLFACDLD